LGVTPEPSLVQACNWVREEEFSMGKRTMMGLGKRAITEAVGTFWLVFIGAGSAVLATSMPLGIGYFGVAFAFGVSVLCLAYAIGHISGCHLNPAVSIGLAVGGRFSWIEVPAYIVAQVAGAIAAGWALLKIAHSHTGFDVHAGFASQGYGLHSPGGYSLHSCMAAEAAMTCLFVLVILGSTDTRAPKGFAPIPIGLALTLAHLICIPVTNASINPARSTGTALFCQGWAIHQLWLFWLAPIAGAIIAGVMYGFISRSEPAPAPLPRAMKA
jgi:aquaporin Z